MNFINYLKSNKLSIVMILLVLIISIGFNVDMLETKEREFAGILFDLFIAFAGGNIAYQYATWFFNKKS